MEMEQQQVQLPIMIKSRFKRICVYCGSTPGKNPSYQIAAIQLGKQLVIKYISYIQIEILCFILCFQLTVLISVNNWNWNT
jgi:predicted Rossmann-fold nucleotide-binding protein